jgi:hypothetical protein
VGFLKGGASGWSYMFKPAKILINEKEISLAVGDRDKIAESLANVIRHLMSR